MPGPEPLPSSKALLLNPPFRKPLGLWDVPVTVGHAGNASVDGGHAWRATIVREDALGLAGYPMPGYGRLSEDADVSACLRTSRVEVHELNAPNIGTAM